MPRTKVSSTKRNREEAIREEKIREVERLLESVKADIDLKLDTIMTEFEIVYQQVKEKSNAILDLPIDFILDMDFSGIKTLCDNRMAQKQAIRKCSDDAGYITEDSGNSASASASGSSSALTAYLSMTQRSRTQLSSHQKSYKGHQRRSRSACTDNKPRSAVAPKASSIKHSNSERCKLRTPMSTRTRAISADRTVSAISASSAILRWPKPGESVVSVHGSPLVAQVVPDRCANVNIPIKNGVLSLRPQRLADIDTTLLDKFDDETLDQMKTLQENMDKILSMVTKYNKP